MKGLQDGPNVLDPIHVKKTNSPKRWLALFVVPLLFVVFAQAPTPARAGIQDGPDGVDPFGVGIVISDGVTEVFWLTEFCRDFPSAPYCKRKASQPKPQVDHAPQVPTPLAPCPPPPRPWSGPRHEAPPA